MVRSAFDTRDGTAYATAADNPSLNFGAGSMSIEGWIRSETDFGTILDKHGPTGGGYTLYVDNGQLGFYMNAGPSNFLYYVPGSTCAHKVAVGAWTHFAIVLDRPALRITAYVNGHAIGTPGSPVAGSMDNAQPLFLGRSNPTNLTTVAFHGAMDEITMYNQALSTADIEGIYFARSAGKHVLVHPYDSIPSTGLGSPYCVPFTAGGGNCPCTIGNAVGHGCNNSSNTGGAILSATGAASLTADSVAFTCADETPTGLSVLLQGNALTAAALFGQGLLCTGGNVMQLYTANAVGGSITVPNGAQPSVSARSAALGDPIAAGTTRYYQMYYQDPIVPLPCDPQLDTFNTSQGLAVTWVP
jgi:hypothetical protein